MEFITTKGKPALIFDGSRLPLNKRMDNGVCYWRCAKRACPARITIEWNDLKQQTAPHNHAVDVVDTQVKGDLERHEKKSQEEIIPVPEIYINHIYCLFLFNALAIHICSWRKHSMMPDMAHGCL